MRLAYPLVRPWTKLGARRYLATVAPERPRIPQTVIEKVVQKYAVGLPDGKVVKAGDYVMIQPEHVMTHDNTGPVISKCVFTLRSHSVCSSLFAGTDSNRSGRHEYRIPHNPSLRWTMTSRINRRRTSRNMPPLRSSLDNTTSISFRQDGALDTKS
jgi:hypothetical protein